MRRVRAAALLLLIAANSSAGIRPDPRAVPSPASSADQTRHRHTLGELNEAEARAQSHGQKIWFVEQFLFLWAIISGVHWGRGLPPARGNSNR